jgi:hypothetical protein
MSNDNQFWLGLLKGAYEGGLGNPAVGEARKQSELEQQYKQAQLNQNAAEKGMVPDTSQNYAHPAHPIWDTIKSAMFPGGGGQPLQTAFKPDPNAMVYGQDPTGTVSTSKGAVAPGSVKLPTEKGATLLAEQARKKSGEKDRKSVV